jgi:hypothetical protein
VATESKRPCSTPRYIKQVCLGLQLVAAKLRGRDAG